MPSATGSVPATGSASATGSEPLVNNASYDRSKRAATGSAPGAGSEPFFGINAILAGNLAHNASCERSKRAAGLGALAGKLLKVHKARMPIGLRNRRWTGRHKLSKTLSGPH